MNKHVIVIDENDLNKLKDALKSKDCKRIEAIVEETILTQARNQAWKYKPIEDNKT